MNGIEVGTCECCGKTNVALYRTYFYYPIHCECCGCKNSDGQKQHFVSVCHCKDCKPKLPSEIHPELMDMNGNIVKTSITGIMPCRIDGEYILSNIYAKYMGH